MTPVCGEEVRSLPRPSRSGLALSVPHVCGLAPHADDVPHYDGITRTRWYTAPGRLMQREMTALLEVLALAEDGPDADRVWLCPPQDSGDRWTILDRLTLRDARRVVGQARRARAVASTG